MFSGSGGSGGGNLVQRCWGLDFPKQDELRLPWVAIWHILMHIHKGGLGDASVDWCAWVVYL